MRKHTARAAARLGVSGYVWNTADATVKGEMCGPADRVAAFQQWLRTEGSPKARIDRAEFSPTEPVAADPFGEFKVRKVTLPNGSQFATAPRRKLKSKKSNTVKKKSRT